MKGVLVAIAMVMCFAVPAYAQDCDGKECEAELQTLEQLQAAQTQDKANMQKVLERWQQKMLADPIVVKLKQRMNIRAGAIKREEQLREAGVIKEKKLEKKAKKE